MENSGYISPSMINVFTIAVIAILLVLRPDNTMAKVYNTVQRTAIIKGVVLNEYKKPMPDAVVTFYKDKITIANEITDKKGYINYEVNEVGLIDDAYEIDITHPGYDKYRISIPCLYTGVKFKVRMKVGSDLSDECDELLLNLPSAHYPKKTVKPSNKASFNLASAPLIDPFEPTKRIITSEEIEKMAR